MRVLLFSSLFFHPGFPNPALLSFFVPTIVTCRGLVSVLQMIITFCLYSVPEHLNESIEKNDICCQESDITALEIRGRILRFVVKDTIDCGIIQNHQTTAFKQLIPEERISEPDITFAQTDSPTLAIAMADTSNTKINDNCAAQLLDQDNGTNPNEGGQANHRRRRRTTWVAWPELSVTGLGCTAGI
jgi:hypothetical protein